GRFGFSRTRFGQLLAFLGPALVFFRRLSLPFTLGEVLLSRTALFVGVFQILQGLRLFVLSKRGTSHRREARVVHLPKGGGNADQAPERHGDGREQESRDEWFTATPAVEALER